MKQKEARMMTNEFFNTAGTDRNRQVVCADGFTMSVQAHDGAYCTPRMSGAPVYTHVEVGFPSQREDLLMQFAACLGSHIRTGSFSSSRVFKCASS